MKYKESLIGFHNPHIHKGLTPEEFLKEYIVSQKKKYRKKNGYKRKHLVEWIEKNWNDQLKFVARLFPFTLKEDKGSTTNPSN